MWKRFSKDYLVFALVTVISAMVAVAIFTYISFRGSVAENSINLQKSAKDISLIVSESFDYTNQINNHIGQQIAHHGTKDLKFILELFREADQIKHRNSGLFSWSSFDWVDAQNYQTVNSRLGLRKDPPDMSDRQYTTSSRQHPWTLQTSLPALGNPSKSWVIPTGTGVVDKNGKYLGAVVVGFDVAELSGRIEQKLNGKTSFVVLDQDLRIVLQSVDIDLARDSDFFQKNFRQNIFLSSSGALEKTIKIGDIRLSHYSNIPKYSYTVITGFDKSFFGNQFNSLILPRIIEFICLAIFLLIILHLFEAKITALLRVEKSLRISLEKTNKDKDKILFSIAHDIKNQIFGINGLANFILEKKTRSEISNNEDLRTVEIISDQSEELMEFVKDLLDTNQIERGEFRLGKIRECSVKPLVTEAIAAISGFATSNQIELETDIENNIPKLRCDEYKMRQILVNLIVNAIKYSYAKNKVLISAKYLESTKQICIEIVDNGCGMNEEEVTKYLSGAGMEIDKSEIAKKKKLDSHGIGMSVVLKLLELHKGKIKVQSDKNSGTKISLYFDHRSFDGDDSFKPTNINSDGKSILLVEDNPVNIKVTRRVLESSGYKVFHAENGKEALEFLDKENFDLILMDGEMPVMNGYEAARAIREGSIFKNFKNYRSIPIIALTSLDDEKTVKKALDSGMNCLIEKAISKTNLLKTIENFLLK